MGTSLWHITCKPIHVMRTGPVLIIDDDLAFCQLVSTALKPVGFDVLAAHDGSTGLKLAREARPPVILLDMILPGLGGVRTCQQLKQDAALAASVVVAITASPDLRYIEQAFRAGAEFFLMKPFGTEKLVQVIQSAAQRSKVGGRRRSHPRFPVDLRVRCVQEEVGGRAVNASLSGLQLYLAERLAPGTTFHLQLDLPTGTITAEAKVIWQDDDLSGRSIRYNHGVQILRFVEDSGFLQYKRFLSKVVVKSDVSSPQPSSSIATSTPPEPQK